MKRRMYFNYISDKLNTLGYRIIELGKLNILDLNIHAESFYKDLLNIVYNINLVNCNSNKQNYANIDLIDTAKKVYIQITSNTKNDKVLKAVNDLDTTDYKGYELYFFYITDKHIPSISKKAFKMPTNIIFDPLTHRIPTSKLLTKIKDLDIGTMSAVYCFVKNELQYIEDDNKLYSDLSDIINVLSETKIDELIETNLNSFSIEDKIAFNKLDSSVVEIDDYKVYYGTIDKIYNNWNSLGQDKSGAVLNTIRKRYLTICNDKTTNTADQTFQQVIDEVIRIINNSNNPPSLSTEILETYTTILVVDAFIRCKIFKNPKGDSYAIT